MCLYTCRVYADHFNVTWHTVFPVCSLERNYFKGRTKKEKKTKKNPMGKDKKMNHISVSDIVRANGMKWLYKTSSVP